VEVSEKFKNVEYPLCLVAKVDLPEGTPLLYCSGELSDTSQGRYSSLLNCPEVKHLHERYIDGADFLSSYLRYAIAPHDRNETNTVCTQHCKPVDKDSAIHYRVCREVKAGCQILVDYECNNEENVCDGLKSSSRSAAYSPTRGLGLRQLK